MGVQGSDESGEFGPECEGITDRHETKFTFYQTATMTPSEEELVAVNCGLTIVSLSLENETVQEFCFRQLLTSKQDIYEYNNLIFV